MIFISASMGLRLGVYAFQKIFKIKEKNSAIASRIIKDTLESELIKFDDPASSSRKFAKYIPFWA